DPLVFDRERDLAFEDVEAFFLPAVDVRWGTAARTHERFNEGIIAVGVLASRQEAIHVAHDGDGAAFGRAVDDGIAAHPSFLGCGPLFKRLTASGRHRWRSGQPPACPVPVQARREADDSSTGVYIKPST